jgi:hypothetical protein
MKKYIYLGSKIVLSLILLMPILGITGLLGEPTPELYNTREAYDFIMALTTMGIYINYAMVAVSALAIVALWTGRTALAALLVLPVTVNVVGFHLFLDGGLFTMGAFLGNVMALINFYLLYEHRRMYQPLLERRR